MSSILLTVLASLTMASGGSAPATNPPTPAIVQRLPDELDAGRVQAVLAKGDSLEAAGRIHAARWQFRKLIGEQRAAGQYPREALWHLANSYYFRDEELRAAFTLDELAEAAAEFGDPRTELRASFQAGIIYQRYNQPTHVAAKLERVRALLHSPVIDDATKQQVKEQLVKG
jgi:hypothetical protein